MKNRSLPLIAVFCALLYTWLFLDAAPGVNVGIFNTVFLAIFLFFSGTEDRKPAFWFFMANALLLSWAVAWHGNYFTVFALLLNLVFLGGAAALRQVGSVVPFFREAFFQLPLAQAAFLTRLRMRKSGRKAGFGWKYYFTYGIPALLLISLFIYFYRRSNAIFDSYVDNASLWLGDLMDVLDLQSIGTFFIGLLLVNVFFFAVVRSNTVQHWANRSPYIRRIRISRTRFLRRSGLTTKLAYEYKAAVFLIAVLNLLLLVLNISDLRLVWFGFEWHGQLLREFVHEGTWFLIVSMCIAAITSLFLFRANLNFYSRNKGLKFLVYIWLFQNGFLALSVLLRNLRYIDYYGLAYLRIGVFFFLAAVLGLLLFVYLKLKQKEDLVYFLNRNMALGMALITICGLVDWSAVITDYNLSHYKKSFVHLQFLAHMPNRCLPILLEYSDKLPEIREKQRKMGYGYSDTLNEGAAGNFLEQRRAAFLIEYQQSSWKERTFANSRAYEALQTPGRQHQGRISP